MRAAVRDRYGPPEVVRIEEVETPTPVGDQVLVRVGAASVNRADLDALYPRWQFTRLFSGLRAPRERRVGLDVAGTVESVGPDATRFAPGDRVFGDMFAFGQGAFAEYACAPERAFAAMPAGTSFETAATLPHSAILALQALRYRGGRTLEAGERVLIVGASGNVGPFAIQIAKSRGAHVTGVARTEKLDFVRELGADAAVDFTTTDWMDAGERYHWILDVEARRSVLRARHALRRGGAYVSLGGPTRFIFEGMLVGPVVGRATGRSMSLLLWWKPFAADDVATLTSMVETGTLVPRVDRSFALDDVVDALRYVESGQARGKVLVIP